MVNIDISSVFWRRKLPFEFNIELKCIVVAVLSWVVYWFQNDIIRKSILVHDQSKWSLHQKTWKCKKSKNISLSSKSHAIKKIADVLKISHKKYRMKAGSLIVYCIQLRWKKQIQLIRSGWLPSRLPATIICLQISKAFPREKQTLLVNNVLNFAIEKNIYFFFYGINPQSVLILFCITTVPTQIWRALPE